MPGQWPLDTHPAKILSYRTSAAGLNTLNFGATASATPHTKGDWAFSDLFPYGANGFLFVTATTSTASTDTSTLMDIGIEAPGQGDRVVLADLQVGYMRGRQKPIYIPFHLPRDSYFAFRIQSAVASKSITFCFDTCVGEGPAALSTPQKFTTYGTVSASSRGTLVTPGHNTKGSWVELTASTTAPIHELFWNVQGTGTTGNDGNQCIDIAIGGSGSETIIAKDLVFSSNNTAQDINYEYPQMLPRRFNIPAGVRLSVRAAAADAAVADLAVSVVGITY